MRDGIIKAVILNVGEGVGDDGAPLGGVGFVVDVLGEGGGDGECVEGFNGRAKIVPMLFREMKFIAVFAFDEGV